jgi:hypothetical protein
MGHAFCGAVLLHIRSARSDGSQMLGLSKARAHTSFDVRTGRLVAANPVGLPPVPDAVDVQVGQLVFYLTGTLDTLMWIDSVRENHKPTKPDLIGALQAIDSLCRRGLESDHKDYDALDMVTLNNQSEVLKHLGR